MIDYCKTLGKHIPAYTQPEHILLLGWPRVNGALDQYLLGLSSCLARRGSRQTPGRNGGEQDCSGARDSLFPANPFKISWMVLKTSGQDACCFSERPTEFPLDKMGLDPFIMDEAKTILKANISSKNMLFVLVPNHKHSSFLFLKLIWDSLWQHFYCGWTLFPKLQSALELIEQDRITIILFFFLNTI